MNMGMWARIISMSTYMGYEATVREVRKEFNIGEAKIRLSFSMPAACSTDATPTIPPVLIQCDRDIRYFMEKLSVSAGLSLLLSIGDKTEENMPIQPTLEGATQFQWPSTNTEKVAEVHSGNRKGDLHKQKDGQTGGMVIRFDDSDETDSERRGEGQIGDGNNCIGDTNSATDYGPIIRLLSLASNSNEISSKSKKGEKEAEGNEEVGTPFAASVTCTPVGRTTGNKRNGEKGKAIARDDKDTPKTPVDITEEEAIAQLLAHEAEFGYAGNFCPTVVPPTPLRRRQPREFGESSRWMDEPRRWGDISSDVFQYCKDRTTVVRNLNDAFNEVAEEAIIETDDGEGQFDDGTVLEEDRNGQIIADSELQVGRVYISKGELQTAVALYAIRRKFSYVPTKSDQNRVILNCEDRTCPWRLFATRVAPESENFEIKTLNLRHSCSIATRANYGKRATTRVIAEVLKSRYTNGKAGPRASEIPELMLAELKVAITYKKGWRAKENALHRVRGRDNDAFKLLSVHLHLLEEANPGTVCTIVRKPGKGRSEQFKYLFIAIGACIAGMKHMRNVIVIDATEIKAKFKGCLISACMQDGNFQIFPIAFAVVDRENEDSWTWFFQQLKQVAPDEPDLVLVSDRHPAIYTAINAEYPAAFHGACAVHLERNVKKNFRGKGLDYLVRMAARAYTVGEFREWFGELRRRSPPCADYLDTIPLPHWTQAYCTAKRYNIMSSNIAESWNHAIEKAIKKPIIGMIETLRLKIMEWFCVRRAQAEAATHRITDNANKLLIRHQEESASMNVFRSSAYGFQVEEDSGRGYYVELMKKQCTCKKFQKLALPCAHALAAARHVRLDGTSLAGDSYTANEVANGYKVIIYPVRNVCDADIPKPIEKAQYSEPDVTRGAGRPRKRRIRSEAEKAARKGKRRCSSCKQTGHNRATCKDSGA